MPKNIVVFSDGTGQDGAVRLDARLSNIYKLYRASRIGPDTSIDPADQVAFYDPGLGTESDSQGFGRLSKIIYKWGASIAGRGIGTNIADCYEFIINHWQPGDRIFLFGFSRGAYTARCVAQVISLCGVPTHAADAPNLPFKRFGRDARLVAEGAVHEVYEHGAGYPRATYELERDELSRRFRVQFGSEAGGKANACPHFIGVFDTVAALGASGWKRIGIIAGLIVAATAVLAAVSGVVFLAPGWLFWRLLLVVASIALLLAFGRSGGAIVAGLVLTIGAAVSGFLGRAMELPDVSFWQTGALIGFIAALTTLIKLKHDSFRFIDDFPQGSRRKGHHIRWKADNYDRGLSRDVGYARHAESLDETRAEFPKVGWGKSDKIRSSVENEPNPFVQLYFPGNHSDIGGSYPEPESRLSDVALQWMVDEVESIPIPLLIEHSLLRPFPDPTGMQHDEPDAVRQNTLWWVPSWAPQWLKRGWVECHRLANGFPVHPSVFQRFAATSVNHYGESRPYRPSNLIKDPRLSAWFGHKDPNVDRLMISQAAAGYMLDKEVFPLLLGKANSKLAALIKANEVTTAYGVFPGDPDPTPDTITRDALAHRTLSAELGRAGHSFASLTRLAAMPEAVPEHGFMIFGLTDNDARALARSFNALTMLTADATGQIDLKALVT